MPQTRRVYIVRAARAWRWWWWWCLALTSLIGLILRFLGQPAVRPSISDRYAVTQRGREFRPASLAIRKGDVVNILNDDGDLPHHAYISSEGFRFDSGDQEPGQTVAIPFTVEGTFNVLCGIHPKMHLTVNVH